jgi:hypothetical protein
VTLLGAPLAIQTATAAADPIAFNETDKRVPSEDLQVPPPSTAALAVCPGSHPNVTGGGAVLAKIDPNIQLWSTTVVESQWLGIASNLSADDTRMTVTVLCAKRGRFSYPETNKDGDFDEQVQAGVNCPPGKKLTGGGVDGRPLRLSAKRGGVPPPELASTRPEDGPDANSRPDDRWVGAVGRGNVDVSAICAKKAGTFKYVHSDREPLPRGDFGFARAKCPVGTQVTGGGVDTTGIDPGLQIIDSSPDASGAHQNWEGTATNTSRHGESIQTFAICRV